MPQANIKNRQKIKNMNVNNLNKQQINVTRQQINKWLGGIKE